MLDGILDRKIEFEEYVDTRFAQRALVQTAWKFQPGDSDDPMPAQRKPAICPWQSYEPLPQQLQ